LYKYFSRVRKDGNDSERQPVLPVPKEIKIVDEAVCQLLFLLKSMSAKCTARMVSPIRQT